MPQTATTPKSTTPSQSGLAGQPALQIQVQNPATPVQPVWQQPVLWSAVIALLGTLVLILMNDRLHRSRIAFDEKLAQKKYEYDRQLAERKFQFDRDLEDWRRRSDFAETALADFYEARSRMSAIRSPGSYSSENDDRIGRDEEPEFLRNARDSYYPYLRRVRENSDFFNAFYSRRYRAQALFGAEIAQAYGAIWKALVKVNIAAGALLQHAADTGENQQEFLESMRKSIWEGLAEPDPITANLDAAVAQAEGIFQPIVSALPQISE